MQAARCRLPSRVAVAAVLGVLQLTAACGGGGGAALSSGPTGSTGADRSSPGTEVTAAVATPTTTPVRRGDRVERLLANMTLGEKVRQLLIVRFSGTSVPTRLIRSVRPGGVVYFADNLVDKDQVRRLSDGLQRVSRAVGLPLLISTDQEGGTVTRLPAKVSLLPGGAELDGDAALARNVAYRTAVAMHRMGLNLNFAPVADVNTVGDAGVIGARALGSAAGVISPLVRAQVCGYHQGGVAATVKHFPGHGSATVDSHESLPTLRLTLRQWRGAHLPPFLAGMASGVDAVMAGHLAFRRLDASGRPATLSRPMIKHWLRGRLGYDGVVVTDALNMGAVVSRGTPGQVAVQAIRAGVDLLLMSPRPAGAVHGIFQAVHNGRIGVRRIDQSVERILRLKHRLGLLGSPRHLGAC